MTAKSYEVASRPTEPRPTHRLVPGRQSPGGSVPDGQRPAAAALEPSPMAVDPSRGEGGVSGGNLKADHRDVCGREQEAVIVDGESSVEPSGAGRGAEEETAAGLGGVRVMGPQVWDNADSAPFGAVLESALSQT